YLIGFNRTLSGLQVYRVLNVSASAQQLVEAGSVPHKTEFWHFFKLAWSQTFTGFGETLHRDLCLVTPNMRFIIAVRLRRSDPAMSFELPTTSTSNAAAATANAHQRTSSRPNMLSCIRAMEDITLLVIDMYTGRLIDTREYPSDIIYLSGHNGISIYEDRICLLSLKHQCLRILRVEQDGRLVDMQEIGWYTREDDSIYEDSLLIRERQALAERTLKMHREMEWLVSQTFSGCIDEADMSVAAKRRKIANAQRTRSDNEQAFRTFREGNASSYGGNNNNNNGSSSSNSNSNSNGNSNGDSAGGLSPSVPPIPSASQGLVDTYCPNVPSATTAMRQPRTSSMQLTTNAGEPLPFIFGFSVQAHMLRNSGSTDLQGLSQPGTAIDEGAVSSMPRLPQEPIGSDSIINTLLELRNPMLPVAADRASFMPLQTLQRLTPHYRMLYTRAMQHPAARLESLADSDISIIEPSLTLAPHSGLKQRLLGALFLRAKMADDNGMALQYFYRMYRQYEGLVLWRAQFIASTRLLLRFVPLQVATSRSHAPRSSAVSSSTMTNSFTLLAEYDTRDAKFCRIWDTAESDLYEEIEKRLDVYRAPMSSGRGLGGSSAGAQAPSISNDVYLRDAFRSSQSAIRTARSGGPVQAARKASMLLPVAPQCVQESPLLDPSRFKCNLRVRQTLEKLRPAGTAPIRFYDRQTGAVKFVLSSTPYYYTPTSAAQSSDDPIALQPMQYAGVDDEMAAMSENAGQPASSGVLRSGAVLLPSGGTGGLSNAGSAESSGGQNVSATPNMTPQNSFAASGHKAG
ncbi:hypothetical protein LPJ56_004111, partial [Coemansia sp. RSA 2599]